MDDAFLRTVATLQANLRLLESQQGALSEFQDMQALRRLKSELADYIAGHAEKGELPADPFATVALRLEALKAFFSEAESASQQLLDCKIDWINGIPHIDLESLQHAATELAESEAQLPNIQQSLRCMLDPRDWDESGSQPILHHELRICGQTMHRLTQPSADSCADLHGFAHGMGKKFEQVLHYLFKIKKRIFELISIHADHLSKLHEAEQHLSNKNFRSAEKAMNSLIIDSFSDINYFDVDSELKKQIAFFERVKTFDFEIGLRLRKGELKDVRNELNSLQNLASHPNSELELETAPLLANADRQLARFLSKRKNKIATISIISACCLAGSAFQLLFGIPIETEATILSHPPGAQVLWDEKPIGETPIKVSNLSPFSEWQMTLQKEGYEMLLIRGKTGWQLNHESQTHQLKVQPQKAVVITEPAGAEIRSNGEFIGTTPWESTPMTIGAEVNYQLDLPGYIKTDAKGKIPFGRSLELKIKLNQGEFEAQDFSFDYRLKLAKEGGAYAQALVGNQLYFGPTEAMDAVQISERKSKGKAWIEKSAEQSHPLGLAIKGSLTFIEPGRVNNPKESEVKAIHQYEQAIKNGLLEKAENADQTWWFYVGLACLNGRGVAKNAPEAVKWFRKAAEQGNADAQHSLGCCYYSGEGVAMDHAGAVKWIRKAAEQGNAAAQYNLGQCYDHGVGVAKDQVESVKWYRKAAEQGNAAAQYNLGQCYDRGVGVAKDQAESLKWYRKSAEQDNSEAMGSLGLCYAIGEGITKDPAEAVKWFRVGAELGNATSQCGLGWCYANGFGLAKDGEKGLKWLKKAAEQDNATAQYNLGSFYAKGEFVAKNAPEAVKWFRKAAEQGHVIAQRRLGDCYGKGEGVAKDHAGAVKWYRKAADQGDAPAQVRLGLRYGSGEGVAKDQVESVKWFKKAAEQGAPEAQYSLGRCYFHGEGVAKDQAESVQWFRKAAEQGLAIAQYALARCYANGEGVAKDHAEEVKWLGMAAKQGDEKAQKRLRELGIR